MAAAGCSVMVSWQHVACSHIGARNAEIIGPGVGLGETVKG